MLTQPTHSRSAWSISLLFHFCLILAVAVVVANAPRAMPADEPARPASIVLRHVDQDESVEYFDDPNETEGGEEAAPAEPVGDVENAEANSLAEALPSPTSTPQLPELPQDDPLGPLMSPTEFQVTPTNREIARNLQSGNDQAVIDADLAAQRRRAAGRPSGPAAEVSLFGSSAVSGHRFLFVIDRSKSMGGEGLGVLEAADGQLAGALEQLKENHSFQVIAYNDNLARFPPKKMAPATGPAKQQAIEFVRGLAAFRGTEHGLALLAAANTKADVIFLLTDGGYPEPAAYEIRDIVSSCGSRASIHALQFGYGPVEHDAVFMHTLAKQTGGSYSYVDVRTWK